MIGYSVLNSHGFVWRVNQGGLFPLSPSYRFEDVQEGSWPEYLRRHGLHFARWETEFDALRSGQWWHVIKDTDCSMDSLSGSTRSKVRRGLKRFDVAVASRASIVEEGYSVYLEACSRYETHEAVYSQDEFVEAVDSLPDCTEFWAVREVSGGELVAFSENYVEDQTCFYNTIWFRPASLKQYSSYALFFGMNRHYLEERGFRYVSDGARSLSHDTSIHEFLESKFGFRKAYAKLHVVYRPWLGVLVALAFPFRTVIERVPLGPFRKASILLRQEAVRRSCQKDTR